MGVLTLTKHTGGWWPSGSLPLPHFRVSPTECMDLYLPVPLLLDALEFAVTEDALHIPGHHSSPRTW